MSRRLPLGHLGADTLGDYLREQRQSAKLSLRQLAELAGISNPYLSQIERGLKKPSAEILQQLAKGLEVSAESLYVKAGILDERHGSPAAAPDTRAVIGADPRLTSRQKAALLDVYDSFVGAEEEKQPRRRRRPKSASGTTTPEATPTATAAPAKGAKPGSAKAKAASTATTAPAKGGAPAATRAKATKSVKTRTSPTRPAGQ